MIDDGIWTIQIICRHIVTGSYSLTLWADGICKMFSRSINFEWAHANKTALYEIVCPVETHYVHLLLFYYFAFRLSCTFNQFPFNLIFSVCDVKEKRWKELDRHVAPILIKTTFHRVYSRRRDEVCPSESSGTDIIPG